MGAGTVVVSDGARVIESVVKSKTTVGSFQRIDLGMSTHRECISIVIGLYDLIPGESIEKGNERWLKRRAREYCLRGALTLTADPD